MRMSIDKEMEEELRKAKKYLNEEGAFSDTLIRLNKIEENTDSLDEETSQEISTLKRRAYEMCKEKSLSKAREALENERYERVSIFVDLVKHNADLAGEEVPEEILELEEEINKYKSISSETVYISEEFGKAKISKN